MDYLLFSPAFLFPPLSSPLPFPVSSPSFFFFIFLLPFFPFICPSLPSLSLHLFSFLPTFLPSCLPAFLPPLVSSWVACFTPLSKKHCYSLLYILLTFHMTFVWHLLYGFSSIFGRMQVKAGYYLLSFNSLIHLCKLRLSSKERKSPN